MLTEQFVNVTRLDVRQSQETAVKKLSISHSRNWDGMTGYLNQMGTLLITAKFFSEWISGAFAGKETFFQ